MNRRAVILSTAVMLCFCLVVLRLAVLMIVEHDRLSKRGLTQYQDTVEIAATRGKIYDRRGRELATNIDSQSIYCDPSKMTDYKGSAKALARALGIPYGKLLSRLSPDRRFEWIMHTAEERQIEAVKALAINGVGFVPEVKRVYPKGSLASQLIGFTGSEGKGLEGLEFRYDDILKGSERNVLVLKDAGGWTLSEGDAHQTRGNDIHLTIDEGLQYIVEKELDAVMQSSSASAATAVMLEPYTGKILAMASTPDYDLNKFSSANRESMKNRALIAPYEPGSTFKLVTASAALEEGVTKVDTLYDASAGFIRVGGKTITDTHKKGIIPFKDVIKVSSNVGMIMVGQRLKPETLYGYARRFGFGQKSAVDLPGENPGNLKPVEEWSETSLAAVSIGYETMVTPLQIARAYAVVANGGYLVNPHVVSKIVSPEGYTLFESAPEEQVRVISARTASIMREILASVTEEGGTAEGARVEGNRVAGKTGTTRVYDPEIGAYSKEKYVSSFVGFTPVEAPRFVLAVVLFEPKGHYYGGVVAAPVFSAIAEQALAYLNVPRDDMFKQNVLMVKSGSYN